MSRPPHPHLEPFEYEGTDQFGSSNLAKAVAIQAISEGRASEHQQQIGLKCIVEDLCKYYGLSYTPGDSEQTAFGEGKRFVGAQIAKLTRINYNELKD